MNAYSSEVMTTTEHDSPDPNFATMSDDWDTAGNMEIDVVDCDRSENPQKSTTFPVPWKHPLQFALRTISLVYSLASLLLILAVLAALPIFNFYVLGYFLNVEGRVGRSGKLRDGFPLLNSAPKLVTIVIGMWLFLLPLRFLASFAADAHLIDPGGPADLRLQTGLAIARVVVALHIILALARGGSFGCFIRPVKNLRWVFMRLREGTYFETANRAIRDFVSEFEIPRHFWWGLQGFVVAFAWMFLPTLLYTLSEEPVGGQILLTVLGGFLLAIVLSWAPFLQARFTVTNRFSAGFEYREIRELYAHAPIVWSCALIVLYLLSLPLYLFKAFLLPPDAMWPITLIFVVSIFPTRLLTGWAYQHAVKKRAAGKRSHWTIRWLCNGTIIPLLGIYVFILFFTQFLGEQGKAVIFQHHSLLLPSPF